MCFRVLVAGLESRLLQARICCAARIAGVNSRWLLADPEFAAVPSRSYPSCLVNRLRLYLLTRSRAAHAEHRLTAPPFQGNARIVVRLMSRTSSRVRKSFQGRYCLLSSIKRQSVLRCAAGCRHGGLRPAASRGSPRLGPWRGRTCRIGPLIHALFRLIPACGASTTM